MAVKGKGKQIAGKAPASSPSTSSDINKESSKDFKGAGKSPYLPIFVKEEEVSGDELEELIKDRYGKGSEYVVYDEDPKQDNAAVSVEHLAGDPNIWKVKCMVGKEQQIVLSLMHKYADLQRLGTKMDIISAFTLEHVKGYVYIEADKACDVVEACKGFFNIYSTRMGLVPNTEIPHLLSIRNKACILSKGTWVRMKSGNYKGDLGQVVDYDDMRKKATIKLVPRIDLQAIAKKFGGGVSLKEAAVPSPRLISSHELEQFRSHIEIRRDRHSGECFEILDGLMLKDGYLYKKVSIASIVYWGVEPSKDELLKFTEMSKPEEEDVSWLSSVYNVRKKIKPSKDSDLKGSSEKGNSFNLHDLVLFGRKAFGVIIDMGKDGTMKVLRGDKEGQEVITVKAEAIKSQCVDKMFTASDRHRKTICINDIIKVLEGPLEGRQGTACHMYKGTLFIYDESQEGNSGIFCTKSDLCEKITPAKDSFGKGNKASSSFSQDPVISSEQEDSSFSRNRRRESNQIFSVGQTLRIRKGPLKGYLCRVVRIYRSDVTVKLDSLVKVITVDEQLLSDPNLKRDTAGGGLSGNGEQTLGASSWDGGSSSWQDLSTSAFSFSANNDQKSGQEQGADPWAGRVSHVAGDQEQSDPWVSKASITAGDGGSADPWGSKASLAARDDGGSADPWGSKASLPAGDGGSADPWGSKTSLAAGEGSSADPWGSKASLAAREGGSADPSGNKASLAAGDGGSADPWGSKQTPGTRDGGSADPWGTKLTPGAREQEQGVDPWGSSIAGTTTADNNKPRADPWGGKTTHGGSSHSDKTFDSWAKASTASGEENSVWNKTEGVGCEKDGDGWNKPSASSSFSGRERGADQWESKVPAAAKDHARGVDAWGSKASVANKDQGGEDPWASKVTAGVRAEQGQGTDPWVSNVAVATRDKEQKFDTWSSKAALAPNSVGDQNSSWDKAAGGGSGEDGDSWSKPSCKGTTVAVNNSSSSSWETAAIGTKSAEKQEGEPSSWDKAKVSSDGQSGWDMAAGSSIKNNTDGWNNPKSSGGDQVSNWKMGGNEDAWKSSKRDTWEKSSEFEGGRGFGSGGNSWNKPVDSDGGQGSGWGKGSGWDDGAGSGQGGDNGWNRQRDSDGGWGSGRGRGRGRYGGRGNRDEENQDGSSEFGGGRGSGRGRGRGRYGGRGSRDEDNKEGSGDFGGGWGSGRGRGRGWYGGRSAGDGENQDGSGDLGWGSGRGRGWGRYGGRGAGDGDNQDRQGDYGGGWESGRGGGRGRYGERGGTGNEDNQDRTGGSWGSGRGRGQWGGSGTATEENQDKSGEFGGWGSGKSWNQKEQERGAGPWGSSVAGASTDKEQNADPWGSKATPSESNHSDKAFDSWVKASSTSGERNSLWAKTTGGGGSGKDGDGWNKSSTKTISSTLGMISPDQGEGAATWASGSSRDKTQGADPWGSKASPAAKDKGEADPWGGKLAASARDPGQGADAWGSKAAAPSRADKEQKADAWGSKAAPGDSSNNQNSPWNKVAGEGSGKDGDGWSKAATYSTKNGADGWDKPKSFGSNQASNWKKEGNEDAWNSSNKPKVEGQGSEPSSSWEKPKVSTGATWGSSSKNGTNEWNNGGNEDAWKKPRGSDWGGGDSSREGQGNYWKREVAFDGGRGFNRGRGILGRYGGRGNGDYDDNNNHQDRSGSDFGGRGRGWNGDRGGRGGGRGRGRFQSSDWS
ncbi:uncharacterized protein A4U43_C03F19930 [Asparagus officinalis]|uniref:Protein RNA-directed DNA methylation 3 n=1 Tax=Asparagus officinalis TaxID=4686 RepID=A0A5P1FFS9_ASPOF|nr:uncharacterized protein A4U43_C03F19930 [Asparagus officinalis]